MQIRQNFKKLVNYLLVFLIIVIIAVSMFFIVKNMLNSRLNNISNEKLINIKNSAKSNNSVIVSDIRSEYLKTCLLNKFYSNYDVVSESESCISQYVFSEEVLFKKLNNKTFKIWALKIDSIDLFADIKQGTNEETLNKYIGHFEETNFFNGNVGLAAHNRGYPVNYFENLDKLKIGDTIDYRIDNFVKRYKVKSINIIKDTDWTYLKNTNEDMLTLITCVRNRPDYRLCVQAHKESEEILNNAKISSAKNANAESDNAEEICSSEFGNNFIIKYNFSRCS